MLIVINGNILLNCLTLERIYLTRVKSFWVVDFCNCVIALTINSMLLMSNVGIAQLRKVVMLKGDMATAQKEGKRMKSHVSKKPKKDGENKNGNENRRFSR